MFSYFKRLKQSHQRFFALIVGVGIILVWRGVWGLADLYFFPENLTHSFISSILLGLIILTISHHMIKGLT
jgi:hypothetical protein